MNKKNCILTLTISNQTHPSTITVTFSISKSKLISSYFNLSSLNQSCSSKLYDSLSLSVSSLLIFSLHPFTGSAKVVWETLSYMCNVPYIIIKTWIVEWSWLFFPSNPLVTSSHLLLLIPFTLLNWPFFSLIYLFYYIIYRMNIYW